MENENQLKENTLNLFLISYPQKELDINTQIIEIIGGKKLIPDDAVKAKREMDLEKLNIKNMFSETNILFKASRYAFVNVDKIEEEINNKIYILRNSARDFTLLNIIIGPFVDLNLEETNEEIQSLTQSLTGVFRRTEFQKESEIIADINQKIELKRNLEKLSKFYNWQIFEEGSLRGKSEDSEITPMITSAFLVRAQIIMDRMKCIGECQKTYSKDSTPEEVKCECGGDLVLIPPDLNLEEISFVYPEDLVEIVGENNIESPSRLFKYLQDSEIPKNLISSINQFSALKLTNLITIPSKVKFQVKATSDIIDLTLGYKKQESDEILIFGFITDTRYDDARLMSSESLNKIMNAIYANLTNQTAWEETIKKTDLEKWKVTPFVKIKYIEKYPSLKDTHSIEHRGAGNE
ncbi:MAG: hypothetical protein H7641_05895 [Candidatus Heimdallarchaeota archaeon]|nr:hypothetical protein [Candidatus Heimdallarchaeota archaeon]MCK4877093.1 hypothetical protein [Candidatus Heimdallarchaeota archaeon]